VAVGKLQVNFYETNKNWDTPKQIKKEKRTGSHFINILTLDLPLSPAFDLLKIDSILVSSRKVII
jgi:hypothetical protein